jgi:hypothetical protein
MLLLPSEQPQVTDCCQTWDVMVLVLLIALFLLLLAAAAPPS